MIDEKMFDWNNISIGAEKYDFLMKRFNKVDVSKDELFQRKFTGFYRVRRSKELFLKKYYVYMESLKNKPISFKEVIKKLNTFIGTIEPSFSSKLLATLNPNMPVWDQYVLANARITPPIIGKVTIEKCIKTYESLIVFYGHFLKTDEAREMIIIFDKKLSQFSHFTPLKKIDLMFWQKR